MIRFILAILSFAFLVSAPAAFAQMQVTPTVYCLGSCPTTSPSGTSVSPTESTNPSITSTASIEPTSGTTDPTPTIDPCDDQDTSSIMHNKKHKKSSGGFLEMFFKFLMKLIEYFLGGGGNFPIPGTPQPTGGPQPTSGPQPTITPCPDPTTGQPTNAPTQQASVQPTAPVSSPSTAPSGTPSGQTLGCGGIPTPAAGPNVVQVPAGSDLTISSGGTAGNPKIYDGGCNQVGKITIKASNVVVQNFKVCPNGRYGIESSGNSDIIIQNNDIKCIKGPGDLNAITFYGNNIFILYNTAIDWVVGDPGSSHTDFIQTWNNDAGESSSNVTIKGNRAEGPLKGQGNYTIHQCIMAQGKAATDGGGGGTGNSENWLIAENYFKDDWNQCIKLEDIDNAHVTRNTFAGASDRVIEIRETSEGTKYYSDNNVTGSYGSVGATITNGPGPATIPGR
jgi:hypothetical protein